MILSLSFILLEACNVAFSITVMRSNMITKDKDVEVLPSMGKPVVAGNKC